jgi:nucleotide-binding universal stress UspA family protein
MKKILVGVDGSTESRRAAEQSANLAAATGADVVLAYVMRPLPPTGPGMTSSPWGTTVVERCRKCFSAAWLTVWSGSAPSHS